MSRTRAHLACGITAVALLAPLPVHAQNSLDRLRALVVKASAGAQGDVGIAIKHLESGTELFVNADEPIPMASTFKLPVLVELYAKAKTGELKWDDPVDIDVHDLHLGSGDMAYLFDPPGVRLSLHNIANMMMMISDNSAADICLAKAGATDVNARLRALGVDGIRVDRPCQELILDYGGYDTAKLKGMTLLDLRSEMPRTPRTEQTRFALDDKFAADPRDTATARGFVTLLEKIWKGEAVDRASSDAILATMKRCRTGAQRIRGLLPSDTEIAHKTGTLGGVVDDVGIVTLPGDAGHLAIAVLSKRTRAPEEQVERTIAQIARYAYDYFYFTSTVKAGTQR